MTYLYFKKCSSDIKSQHDAAWELLRYAVRTHFGADTDKLEVERTGNGKPYFAGRCDIQFSISHAGGLAVCAVSGGSVGVDVEKVRKISQKVKERFLGGDCDDREAVRRWTRRESYGKLTGEGALFKGDIPKNVAFFEYIPEDNYILTLCVPAEEKEIITGEEAF